MLKNSRIALNSALSLIAALYLGYTFFDLFMEAFVPASLAVPFILTSALGFVLVLRWLGAKEVAPASGTFRARKPQRIKTGIFAPDQQHVFRTRKNKSACRRKAGMVQANHNA